MEKIEKWLRYFILLVMGTLVARVVITMLINF